MSEPRFYPGSRRSGGFCGLALAGLSEAKAHPDIRACVARVDILRLGHAMMRPSVGFVFSEERWRIGQPRGTLFFANSDLSGVSLFEEAQYRGVRAAEGVMGVIGGAFATTDRALQSFATPVP